MLPVKKRCFHMKAPHCTPYPAYPQPHYALASISSESALYVPLHLPYDNVKEEEKKIDPPAPGGPEVILIPPLDTKSKGKRGHGGKSPNSKDQSGAGQADPKIEAALHHPIKVGLQNLV